MTLQLQVAGADTDGLSLCDTDGCEVTLYFYCYCHIYFAICYVAKCDV